MPATITRRLISLADAADALAVSTRTVRRYIADGQLEAVRLGRKTLRIKVDSIEGSSTPSRSGTGRGRPRDAAATTKQTQPGDEHYGRLALASLRPLTRSQGAGVPTPASPLR